MMFMIFAVIWFIAAIVAATYEVKLNVAYCCALIMSQVWLIGSLLSDEIKKKQN